MRQHEADTDNWESGSGVAGIWYGVFKEAWKLESGHEDTDAEKDGDDIWVSNNSAEEFWCEFTLEEEDAVREEGDVEGDNEAAVWNDALFAKGTRDDWIAEEGGIIKDKCELRFETEFALIKAFIKDGAAEQNEHEHHENAGEEAFEEELRGGLVITGWKCHKKWGWHEDGKKEVDQAAINFGVDDFEFTEHETKNHNNYDGSEARIKIREFDMHNSIIA